MNGPGNLMCSLLLNYQMPDGMWACNGSTDAVRLQRAHVMTVTTILVKLNNEY